MRGYFERMGVVTMPDPSTIVRMSLDPPVPRQPADRRPLIAAAVGIAALVIGAVVAFVVLRGSPSATASPSAAQSTSPSPTATERPSPTAGPTARCPLDGEPLAEGTELVEPALAVQIENDPAARPARNLTRADIVIETTVEGDVTRFSAIFLCDGTLGLTGPVRSARYHNIDLWQDLRVLTIGFGASDGALERFADAGMPYPNGNDGGWPWYERTSSREAPHNVYVDLEALRDDLDEDDRLMALADRVDELRPPWTISEDAVLPDDGHDVTSLDIRTNSFWEFGWTWDADLGAYRRSDAGVEIEDEATDEPLAFTSLIVQRVTQEVVTGDPDPGGFDRRLQHLVGSGEGMLYTQGRGFEISWERPTSADGTTWTFTDSGEPLVLPPGEVWWHVLPHESVVTEG
jgi:hypothetical protein